MKRPMVPFIMLLLMVPFISQPVAWADPAYTDSYSEANNDGARTLTDLHPSADGDVSAIYQSFNATTPDATLDSVKFFLKKYGAPVAQVTAYIYDHSGTYGVSSVPTGAALATSNSYQVSALTTTDYQLITFTFSGANRIILTQGVKYVVSLQVSQTTTLTGSHYVLVARDGSTPTHPGNSGYFANSGWADYPNHDMIFYVKVERPVGWNNFYFNNPIYEDNADAGTVLVTAHLKGGTEEFNISSPVWWSDPELPVAFSWPVYSATRYIYVTAEENFTVTLPYDTIGIYSMTVKDKTATGGSAAAYLEAYRDIGGSETLVERMKIIFGNPTPLNLMVGSVYHIKVLFADGSRYDWGYFTATSTTSVNVIIRVVEFGDGAQMIYGTIHVDAERTGALITVDYLDDRDNTIWSNVTIRERNGPIVLSVPHTNSSYTLNWASANTSLGYTVVVEGEHTEFGIWGRSWTLDPTWSFPAFPTLTGIYGSASSDLLPFLLVAVTILIFSYKFQARGLLAGCLMASFLSLFGAASWSYYWLAFAWFIAVMVNINVGGEG